MKTPREYQLTAIKRAQRKHLLLADQCGLGKTISAIEAAKAIQSAIGKPVLIVVPSRIKDQWYAELIEQGIAPERICWLDSKTKDVIDLIGYEGLPPFVLTHYEAAVKHLDDLKLYYYSLIICDEAHRIKNRKAKRSDALKQLKSYRRMALTGTPYDKDPAKEAWSILNWLDPSFFKSFWTFYTAHANTEEIVIKLGFDVPATVWKDIRSAYASGTSVDALARQYSFSTYQVNRILKYGEIVTRTNKDQPIKDPELFAKVLRPYMLQRSKLDVRSDLPENIIQYVPLEMYPDQARCYKELVASEDPIVTIDGSDITVQIVLTQILREIQLTTDPDLLGLAAASIKLDWVKDWLEDNPNESVIIFTRFAGTAKKLHSALEGFELIIGGTKSRKMTSNDRRIIGTIAAMGEGLDLPHIDHAIFIDVEWSSILMQQALDRIHRINIENVKHTYYLLCNGTTDKLLHDALQGKWNTKELIERFLVGKNSTTKPAIDSL